MRLLLAMAALWAAPLHAAEVQLPTLAVTASTPTPWVEVIWPKQEHVYPTLSRSFTFGHVTPGSTLVVNGTMLPVDENGAFFAMAPFSTGTFTLRYDVVWHGLFASTEVVVSVGPAGPPPAPDAVIALSPESDSELRAGDLLVARCKAPGGLTGTFAIKGLTGALPLAESNGLYEGHYFIQPGDKGEGLAVACSFKTGFFGSTRAEAPGKLSIADPRQTRTAVTTRKITKIRSSANGYSFFQPAGVKLEVVGREDSLLRVRLSEHERALVLASSVNLLPEGTPPPRGLVGRWINTSVEKDRVKMRMWATERVPFEIRHTIEPLRFDIRFFNAQQRFDRIRYDSADPLIKAITWRQESSQVVRLTIDTKIAWSWGFDAYYDDEGYFVLELRRPPDLTGSENVLAGRRVIIDPGHGPWASATGPLGTTERDAVLEISEELERLFVERGAETYLTRRSSEGPSLMDRPFDAWRELGDIYVSVHLNAFSVSTDPFEKPRGFMNFYYHPQSRPLVDAVHASYQKRFPEEMADEFVRWGDLYVCRQTFMPAILTESLYVILPEMERKIREPKFRTELAQTMYDGVRNFYSAYRTMQLADPNEKAAARQ